jgi:hypothetical protein
MKFSQWLRIGVFVFASAALQLSLIQGAAAAPYTAEDMQSECEAVLSSAKATADPDAVELDNTFSTGTCWGAFLSVQQIVTLKLSGAKRTMFRVCLPEDMSLVKIIQIFDAYMKRHPERQDEPFTVVAIGSLSETYRCK